MGPMESGRRSARERLLEAADRLFYNEGVGRVGIDRVLEESGVAKGSLYYNFGGKDDLVRAYLQNRHAKWAARLDARINAETDPREKLLPIFDAPPRWTPSRTRAGPPARPPRHCSTPPAAGMPQDSWSPPPPSRTTRRGRGSSHG